MSNYRPYTVEVVGIQRLSPALVRVTMSGESLAGFAGHGFDQRINLIFPTATVGPAAFTDRPDWYEWWRALPVHSRPPLRTYTVRAFRPTLRELDVDFVLHGHTDDDHSGPASRWAATARAGSPITVIGPEPGFVAPFPDVAWAPPPQARHLLLAGDEAAVPALCAIVEALNPEVRATVVTEVPEPADVPEITAGPGVELVHLARSRGEHLVPTVRSLLDRLVAPARRPAPVPAAAAEGYLDDDPWEVPDHAVADGGLYAWLAGEAGTVVALRRHLVNERGIDRRSVAFMGYWRRGRAAAQD